MQGWCQNRHARRVCMRPHKDLCGQMPSSFKSPSRAFPLAQPLHTIAQELVTPKVEKKGFAAMRNKKRQTSLTKAAWMLATALAVALPQAASAETVMRIGMTAADIPRTLGQPDQGFEGNRFTGLTMYDALTMKRLPSKP